MAESVVKPGDTVKIDGLDAVVTSVHDANAMCKMPNGDTHLIPLASIHAPIPTDEKV